MGSGDLFLDLKVRKSSRSLGSWDAGEEAAVKALAGGKLEWEPVGKVIHWAQEAGGKVLRGWFQKHG